MKVKELVDDYINKISDPRKAQFDRSLINTKYEIKGTKTRLIDDFSKSLLRIGANFNDLPLNNYEEILLAGCYIGHSKFTPKEKIVMFRRLLPYIDNWGTCDTVVARLKGLESEKQFFIDLLNEENPFYVRVGIVWLMKYMLKKDTKNVIELVNRAKNNDFYVKMAKAWCNAEALVYDYDFMYNFLKEINDVFIRNKTIEKACYSYRVKDDDKLELKKLKIVDKQ